MPLDKQTINIPFGSGRDAGVDPKLLQPPAVLTLRNGYYERDGEIRRRCGMTALGMATTNPLVAIATKSQIASDGESLFMYDDDNGLSYSYNSTRNDWKPTGGMAAHDVSLSPVTNGAPLEEHFPTAIIGGYHCAVHSLVDDFRPLVPATVRGVYLTVTEISSGREIISSLRLNGTNTYFMAHDCCVCSNILYVVGESATGVGIIAVQNIASGTVSVTGILTIRASGVPATSVSCATSGADYFYVASSSALGAASYVDKCDLTRASVASATIAVASVGDAPLGACRIEYIDGALSVLVKENGTAIGFPRLLLHRYSTAMLSLYGPVEIFRNSATERLPISAVGAPPWHTGCGFGVCLYLSSSATRRIAVVYTKEYVNQNEPIVRMSLISTAGAITTGYDLARGVFLIAGPSKSGSKVFIACHRHQPTTMYSDKAGAGTLHVYQHVASATNPADLEASTESARFMVREHVGARGIAYAPTTACCLYAHDTRRIHEYGGGLFFTALRADSGVVTNAANNPVYDSTLMRVRVSSIQSSFIQSMKIGAASLLSCGVLRHYDGDVTNIIGVEQDVPSFEMYQGAGGSLADATYYIAAIYRRADGLGEYHFSAPTFVTKAVAGGGGVAYLSMSDAATGVISHAMCNCMSRANFGTELELYVNISGVGYALWYASAGGLLGARLPSVPSLVVSPAYAPAALYNSIAAGFYGELLYTTGGVVESIVPPTPVHLSTDGSCCVLIPADRRTSIWVSAPKVPGFGLRFSDLLVYDFPEGGDNVATEWLQGRLILLKRNSIRYSVGEPPTATGSSGFSGSKVIAPDIGCTEATSVIATQFGIIFRSDAGWYLLNNNFALEFIGGPVDDYATYSVVQTVALPAKQQIRILVYPPGGTDGVVLVWDWERKAWSEFVYEMGTNGIKSIAVVDGVFYGLDNDGNVLKESETTYQDNGYDISMTVTTPWIKPSAIAGFGRIWRVALLGEKIGATNINDYLSLYARNDYSSTSQILMSSVQTSSLGSASPGPLIARATLSRQKLTAVQFQISVVSANALNEGLRLSGLSLEVGIDRGLARLAAAATK